MKWNSTLACAIAASTLTATSNVRHISINSNCYYFFFARLLIGSEEEEEELEGNERSLMFMFTLEVNVISNFDQYDRHSLSVADRHFLKIYFLNFSICADVTVDLANISFKCDLKMKYDFNVCWCGASPCSAWNRKVKISIAFKYAWLWHPILKKTL